MRGITFLIFHITEVKSSLNWLADILLTSLKTLNSYSSWLDFIDSRSLRTLRSILHMPCYPKAKAKTKTLFLSLSNSKIYELGSFTAWWPWPEYSFEVSKREVWHFKGFLFTKPAFQGLFSLLEIMVSLGERSENFLKSHIFGV